MWELPQAFEDSLYSSLYLYRFDSVIKIALSMGKLFDAPPRFKISAYSIELMLRLPSMTGFTYLYTSAVRRSIRYQGCKIWNELPVEIKSKNQINYRIFLKYVKVHLHNNQK